MLKMYLLLMIGLPMAALSDNAKPAKDPRQQPVRLPSDSRTNIHGETEYKNGLKARVNIHGETVCRR